MKYILILMLIYTPVCMANNQDLGSRLKHEGTLFRLQGDYVGANHIRDQLRTAFPDSAIGYVFNLNTLVMRDWSNFMSLWAPYLSNRA